MTFRTARNYLDGEWVSGPLTASIGPATGAELGRFADGGAAEADRAVSAARRAFDETTWAHDRHLRSQVLMELADQLAARRAEVVDALAVENGKVLAEATI